MRSTAATRRRPARAAALALAGTGVTLVLAACGTGGGNLEVTGPAVEHPTASGATGNPGAAPETPAASTGRRLCGAPDVRFSAVRVHRPAGRVVLEALNTSHRGCELRGYPLVRFTDGQQAPAAPAGRPGSGSPVFLPPGEKGYAAVRTTAGRPAGGRSVTSLRVQLQHGAGGGTAPARIAAPGGTLRVEPEAARVGTWEPDLRDALAS